MFLPLNLNFESTTDLMIDIRILWAYKFLNPIIDVVHEMFSDKELPWLEYEVTDEGSEWWLLYLQLAINLIFEFDFVNKK